MRECKYVHFLYKVPLRIESVEVFIAMVCMSENGEVEFAHILLASSRLLVCPHTLW